MTVEERRSVFLSRKHPMGEGRTYTDPDPHIALSRLYVRASLVAQWLRIRLPMQGTQVRALVWEDPTCHGATKPVRHNY